MINNVQKSFNVIIKPRREAGITDEHLFELYKDAYSQWLDTGLESSWHEFTQDDFEQFSQSASRSIVTVAIDKETGEPLGAHTLFANKKKGVVNGSALAVASKAKRKGIATALLRYEEEKARNAGYRCMKGITAIDAAWSVNWHLKNGYRIVGYKRLETENIPPMSSASSSSHRCSGLVLSPLLQLAFATFSPTLSPH